MKRTLHRIAGAFGALREDDPARPGPERGRFANIAAAGAIAVVALALSAAPLGGALADGSSTNDWHYAGGCNSQYKVHKDNAGCLSAWWDNSPPASSGVAGGATFGMRSNCSNYGTVVTHIDVQDSGDYHIHLTTGSRKRESSG